MAGTRKGARVEPGMGWEEKAGTEEPRKVKHSRNLPFLSDSAKLLVIWVIEKYPFKGSCLVNSPKRNLLRVDS